MIVTGLVLTEQWRKDMALPWVMEQIELLWKAIHDCCGEQPVEPPGDGALQADANGNVFLASGLCACVGGTVPGSCCDHGSEIYRGTFSVTVLGPQNQYLYTTSAGFDTTLPIGVGNRVVLTDCQVPCPD